MSTYVIYIKTTFTQALVSGYNSFCAAQILFAKSYQASDDVMRCFNVVCEQQGRVTLLKCWEMGRDLRQVFGRWWDQMGTKVYKEA